MKKILSFVLVLAMVLGSVSMVFATDYPDVKDTDSCAEAVNVLSAVGVIEGYNDGTFKPEKTISRAEAIKIVVAALGLPVTEGNSYPTQFTDVPATAWYSGYVRYGVALGITEGTSKDHFSPDSLVTYDQMITFIMRALGYSDKLVGGYPTGYIMRAFQEGIITADTTTGTAPAPRGDIAEILYAALDKAFVVYDAEKDVFNNEPDKYAVGKPDMYSLMGCEAETTWVGGKEVPDYTVVKAADIEDAIADLSNYLGASVQFIKNADGKVVGIGAVETTFVEGKIKSGKIGDNKLALDATDDAVVVFDNGAEQAASTESATVTAASNAKYAVVLNSSGSITKIVSKQTWTIDQAGQIAAGDLDDINLKDEDETGVHTLFGEKFALNEDDKPKTIKTSSFILEGVKALGDIKKDDVVYVYVESKGNTIAKIQVGQEVVEGDLTAINSDQTEFTIGGTVYKLAGTTGAVAAAAMKPLLGKTVKANLDCNGKIYACAEVAGESTDVYGVILTGLTEKGTSGSLNYEQAKIRIFNAEGKTADYKVKDGVYTADDKDQGELVKLTLDDNDVVTAYTIAPNNSPATKITKSGVVDGDQLLSDSSVIFSYTGTTAADKSNSKKYAVVSYSKLLGETPTRNDYFSKSSKVTYAIVEGLVGSSNDTYAVVTGYTFGSKNATVNAYVDAASKSYTAGNDDVEGFFASSASTLYKLTVNDSNKITAAPAQTASKTYTLTTRSTAGTEKTVKIEGGYVTVAEDIVVYSYDATNKKWSAASGVDALVGLKVGNKIDFYDTDSAEGYEIAIVTK